MTLVAGSYEKFIWGFSIKRTKTQSTDAAEGDEKRPSASPALALRPLFSYPAHAGPIKCVAACGSMAVSGGADDSVKIYDLSSCREVGSLVDAGAAVSSVSFYAPPGLPIPRNLVSGSEDGNVSIYDTDPFVRLKSVRAHRKAVSDVTVHPSGRLALSVGRDGCLSMVNLLRGRRSFCCRLDREAGLVRYGLGEGERFFMAAEERVTVHNSEDAKMLFELDGKKRVLCLAPTENGILYTGGEDHSLTAWDISSGKTAYSIDDAHQTRVKGLVVLQNKSADSPYLVATASSDGVIRLWDVRMVAKGKASPVAEASTKSRLTCLAGSY